MKVLVTGAAGFIGSKLAYTLASRGDVVVGVDNYNDYYDVRLKHARVKEFNLDVRTIDIADKASLDALFEKEHFDVVAHLAAQAGVRYSITNPYAYLQSNMAGFLNILEACRNYNVSKLVFASSSSVYGLNSVVPYVEDGFTDAPVSLYAASKKSNELMAHSYSKLYGLQCIGLRYFTVYGPWGRPDMMPMLLAKALCNQEPIKVFNNGDMLRDFTYIDDIVEGTVRAVDFELKPENCANGVPCRIYNIGCGHPVKLMDFIDLMEKAFGKTTEKIFLPMQPGDVYQTFASTKRLETEMGYCPHWSLKAGVKEFVRWYEGMCRAGVGLV